MSLYSCCSKHFSRCLDAWQEWSSFSILCFFLFLSSSMQASFFWNYPCALFLCPFGFCLYPRVFFFTLMLLLPALMFRSVAPCGLSPEYISMTAFLLLKMQSGSNCSEFWRNLRISLECSRVCVIFRIYQKIWWFLVFPLIFLKSLASSKNHGSFEHVPELYTLLFLFNWSGIFGKQILKSATCFEFSTTQ